MKVKFKYQNGLGLIEILITIVVLAVGMLALAQLQTSVTSEARVNKTRSEALEVCNKLVTPFREPLLAASFATLSSSSGSIDTVSETIAYTVTVSGSDISKQISASCSWSEGSVTVNTLAVPHTSVATKLTTGGGDGSGSGLNPSLNANSSVDLIERVAVAEVEGLQDRLDSDNSLVEGSIVAINQGDDIFYRIEDTLRTVVTVIYLCENQTQYPILNSDFGLRAKRVDINSVQPGDEGIKLYESFLGPVQGDELAGNRTLCEAKVLYRGGVILPISGQVHSRVRSQNSYLEVDFLTFDISESGTYCAFDAQPNDTSASYICYLGGNCEYGPFTSDGSATSDFFVCPEAVVGGTVTADNFDMDFDVGEGGWRGKIGLLDVANRGYNVCFADELENTESTRDTAREYKTVVGSGAAAVSTGINKPYECHDFMIIAGVNNPNHVALRNACQAASADLAGERLGPKLIPRYLDANTPNVYQSDVDSTFCAALDYIYASGVILNRGNVLPYVTATDGETITICDVKPDPSDSTSAIYACELGSQSGTLTIQAQLTPTVNILSGSGCTVSAASSSSNTAGCDIDLSTVSSAISTLTFNSITGTISAASESIANFSDSGGGIDTLAVLYDELEIGCELGNYTNPLRSFVCNFYTDDPVAIDSNVSFFSSPGLGYEMTPDYIQDTSAIASAAVTSFPSTRNDFALEISSSAPVRSTRVLSGEINLNDGLGIDDVVINASESACSKIEVDNPFSYQCTIPIDAVSLTLIGGSCSTFSGNPIKKIDASASGNYSENTRNDTGTITIDILAGTDPVNIDFTFAQASGGQNCSL